TMARSASASLVQPASAASYAAADRMQRGPLGIREPETCSRASFGARHAVHRVHPPATRGVRAGAFALVAGPGRVGCAEAPPTAFQPAPAVPGGIGASHLLDVDERRLDPLLQSSLASGWRRPPSCPEPHAPRS